MNKQKKTTLYFTKGGRLSEDDVAAMNSIPGGAFHRNASLIGPDDKLEPCDAVAGPAVPEQYKDKPYIEADVDSEEAAQQPEDMTVAELKAALTEGNIEFDGNAKKADLVALYRDSFEVE